MYPIRVPLSASGPLVGFLTLLLTVAATSALAQPAAPPASPRVDVSELAAAVVRVEVEFASGVVIEKRSGSGTIVSPDGHILTSYRLLRLDESRTASRADVFLSSGGNGGAERRYVAEVLDGDAELDLAVLRIVSQGEAGVPAEAFPHRPIGNSDTLPGVGEEVAVWGFPAGGGSGVERYRGIVSGYPGDLDSAALERLSERAAAEGERPEELGEQLADTVPALESWIATSASYPEGAGGGALLDADGILVGVPAFGLQPLGLARPAILARGLLSGVPGVSYAGPQEEDEPEAAEGALRPGPDAEAELLRRAQMGGRIELAAGTFRLGEKLDLLREVEIVGAGRDRTVILGSGAGAVVHVAGPGVVSLGGLTLARSAGEPGDVPGDVVWVGGGGALLVDVTVEGGSWDETTGTGGSGLHIYSQARATVVDSLISGNQGYGIVVQDEALAAIRSSEVSGNGSTGIRVGGSASVTIEESVVRGNGGAGIVLAGEAAGTVLENNTVDGNMANGIAVLDGAAPTLLGNRVSRNAWNGLAFSGDAAGSAAGNTVEENDRHGIYLAGRSAPTLEENAVRSNALVGIYFGDSSAGTALGNLSESNGFQGIFCGDGASAVLLDNVLRRNDHYGYARHSTADCRESGTRFEDNALGDSSEWDP